MSSTQFSPPVPPLFLLWSYYAFLQFLLILRLVSFCPLPWATNCLLLVLIHYTITRRQSLTVQWRTRVSVIRVTVHSGHGNYQGKCKQICYSLYAIHGDICTTTGSVYHKNYLPSVPCRRMSMYLMKWKHFNLMFDPDATYVNSLHLNTLLLWSSCWQLQHAYQTNSNSMLLFSEVNSLHLFVSNQK